MEVARFDVSVITLSLNARGFAGYTPRLTAKMACLA